MVQTKLKLRMRPRLRTTTKLALVFGLSSMVSISVALVYYFNFSNVKDLYGTEEVSRIVNGKMEVLEKQLLTDFEVKELDTKSPTMAHDTVVLFKKMKP